jgi:hypothetical protein
MPHDVRTTPRQATFAGQPSGIYVKGDTSEDLWDKYRSLEEELRALNKKHPRISARDEGEVAARIRAIVSQLGKRAGPPSGLIEAIKIKEKEEKDLADAKAKTARQAKIANALAEGAERDEAKNKEEALLREQGNIRRVSEKALKEIEAASRADLMDQLTTLESTTYKDQLAQLGPRRHGAFPESYGPHLELAKKIATDLGISVDDLHDLRDERAGRHRYPWQEFPVQPGEPGVVRLAPPISKDGVPAGPDAQFWGPRDEPTTAPVATPGVPTAASPVPVPTKTEPPKAGPSTQFWGPSDVPPGSETPVAEPTVAETPAAQTPMVEPSPVATEPKPDTPEVPTGKAAFADPRLQDPAYGDLAPATAVGGTLQQTIDVSAFSKELKGKHSEEYIKALEILRPQWVRLLPNDLANVSLLESNFSTTWTDLRWQYPDNYVDMIMEDIERGNNFGADEILEVEISTRDTRTKKVFADSFQNMFLTPIKVEINNADAEGRSSDATNLRLERNLLVSSEETLSQLFLEYTRQSDPTARLEAGIPDPFKDRTMRQLVAFYGDAPFTLTGPITVDIPYGSSRTEIIAHIRATTAKAADLTNVQNRQREKYHGELAIRTGLIGTLKNEYLTMDQISSLTNGLANLLSPSHDQQSNLLINQGANPLSLAREDSYDVLVAAFGSTEYGHLLVEDPNTGMGNVIQSVAQLKKAAIFRTDYMTELLNQAALGVIPPDADLDAMTTTAVEGYTMDASAADAITVAIEPFQAAKALKDWGGLAHHQFDAFTPEQTAFFAERNVTVESIIAQSKDAAEAQAILNKYRTMEYNERTATAKQEVDVRRAEEDARRAAEDIRRADVESRRVADVATGRMSEIAAMDHGKTPHTGWGHSGFDFEKDDGLLATILKRFSEGHGEFTEAMAQSLGKSHRLYDTLYGGVSTRANPRDTIGTEFIQSVYDDPAVDKTSLTSFQTALTNKLIRQAGDENIDLTPRDEANYYGQLTGESPDTVYNRWAKIRRDEPGMNYIPPQPTMGRPV